MKKIISVMLLLCLVLGLCACGQSGAETTTEPTTTESVAEDTTEKSTEDDGMAAYKVTVTDEGGNPVVGAMVQICKDDCFPGVTDAEGVATFTRPETQGYKVSFISLPEGYEYLDEKTDFYYEGDAKELTITLKAVA